MNPTNPSPDDPPVQNSVDEEPLLLLSGSGLNRWIWDGFVDALPNGTPIGIANRPSGKRAPLEDYVQHALAAAPAERFTVVAHSLGAVIGLAVATAAPERVAGLVAVAGVVPEPAGSFLTAMPLPNRWVLSIAMRVAGTRPPEKAIRRSLTAGLEASVADRIVNDFTPDSAEVFRSRISRADQPSRRGYIVTDRDAELPPKLQQRFADALDPGWNTNINTGHLPMLEDPVSLAAAVRDFTRDTVS